MAPLLITESLEPRRGEATSQRLVALAEQARLSGYRVASCDEALAGNLPRPQAGEGQALYSGRFYGVEAYRELHQATAGAGWQLPNSPEQVEALMLTANWQLRLAEITAPYRAIRNPAGCRWAFAELGCPVFVKGEVRSRKAQGIEACLAYGPAELERMLAAEPAGVLFARRFLQLRRDGRCEGFPRSREYRCFFQEGQLIGHGYYWGGPDPFAGASYPSIEPGLALAERAAELLEAPLCCVDVAELEEGGQWLVIDAGDPQFSEITQIPPASYFSQLRR